MKELTSTQRRTLRAQAHALHPVVMISDAGLTPGVIREIDANLRSHELIKVRVMGDEREARKVLVSAICDATGAQPVQHIGKILVVYRPQPPEDKKNEPPRARRKPARRLKRSFQN